MTPGHFRIIVVDIIDIVIEIDSGEGGSFIESLIRDR